MMYKTNYHTHSTFCDGKQSLSEMAQAAFDAGIKILGFSSHALFPFTGFWHMDIKKYTEYFATIENLKQEYMGRMEILTGVEADYLAPVSYCDKGAYQKFPLDYMIGSVHYLVAKDTTTICENSVNNKIGGCFVVDGSAKEFFNGVEHYFGGNAQKAIQTYFALEREMMSTCNFDIVGHIDLVRKRNGELHFFDENDSWYRRELKETAKVAGRSGKVVEINTGGMTRVGLKTPYPSPDFLSLLCAEGVPVTINSDCHSVESITDHFAYAAIVAKEAGYGELHYLSGKKWLTTPLEGVLRA